MWYHENDYRANVHPTPTPKRKMDRASKITIWACSIFAGGVMVLFFSFLSFLVSPTNSSPATASDQLISDLSEVNPVFDSNRAQLLSAVNESCPSYASGQGPTADSTFRSAACNHLSSADIDAALVIIESYCTRS